MLLYGDDELYPPIDELYGELLLPYPPEAVEYVERGYCWLGPYAPYGAKLVENGGFKALNE
jgi:hypothetical protein